MEEKSRTIGSVGMIKHGFSGTREYSSWRAAKARCHSPKSNSYANYGGRGITMCDRWRNSFAAFHADMGPRPKGCSLDRRDNDGNYEPENCRWATASQQRRNQRHAPMLTVNGETLSAADWEKRTGVPAIAIRRRIRHGWSPASAITVPFVPILPRRRSGAYAGSPSSA